MFSKISLRSFGKISRKLPIADRSLKEVDPEMFNLIELEKKR